MKTFIDRFTDLLMWHKPLGRKLRGRRFALLSTGSGPEPTEPLTAAFEAFCGYLGIEVLANVYSREGGPFHDDRAVQVVRMCIEGRL